MRIFLLLYIILSFNQLSHADDTEIYGVAVSDGNNDVRTNVLLIVDNSVSMDAKVEYRTSVYDPNADYGDDFENDEFYLNSDEDEGIPLSTLATNESINCESKLNTLNTSGQVYGEFLQKHYNKKGSAKWRSKNFDTDSNLAFACNGSKNTTTLYSGHYLNFNKNSPSGWVDRLDVVQGIVKDLTRSLNNINVGMMSFDTNLSRQGGMIDIPIDNISTNAESIRTTVDGYAHETSTMLSESLFEAQRYFSGSSVYYGNGWSRSDDDHFSSPDSRVSNDSSSSDYNTYKSPIEYECQKSNIIILTDGAPWNDTNGQYRIRPLIQNLDNFPSDLSKNCTNCLAELAYYMSTVDQSDGNSGLNGVQTVSTYTVSAFGGVSDNDFLEKTARYGKGEFYKSDSPEQLTADLNSAILNMLAKDSTFTAPAISVNAFNNSEHRDELFYALFKPDETAKWFGNLKKYRIGDDGKIYDKNDNLAIDASTGFFAETSQDEWSTRPAASESGKDVQLGGIANIITPSTRALYSDESNLLKPFDDVVSESTLGVPSSQVSDITDWIKGYNSKLATKPARNYIGDPLHSEPVVITYGGTDTSPDSTIYFGTNEGFIHAINSETGAEQFAFMPTELHSIQSTYFENTSASTERPYGMDGPITAWMYDLNNDNVIYDTDGNLNSGEHVYLYAGMRRGGNSYYALNVTDRDDPKLLFKIEGGVTPGFEKLGQTWSSMTVAKVKFNKQTKFVLFFTGGYDTNQDNITVTDADTTGNAIYMVDASTGALLWTASNSDSNLQISQMTNSIPASLTAVDITGEGFVDYLFAADTAGRIFRIDINQNNTGAQDFAQGGVIASLAGSAPADKRRFYNKPNVALVKDKQKGDHLTISIGSGQRSAPISNKLVSNRFYVIKDFNPYSAPSTYVSKTEAPASMVTLNNDEYPESSKLYNATALMKNGKSALTNSMKRLMSDGGGWYVTLDTTGEKVLSESTTFSGAVIFTTFSPSSGRAVACEADTGRSKTYILNQVSAMSVVDLNEDGILDEKDSSINLTQSGIAPRPVVIYRQNGRKTIAIGTETIDDTRFNETPPDPDCEAKGTCPSESIEQKCSKGNCYVIPQYWRQNDSNY